MKNFFFVLFLCIYAVSLALGDEPASIDTTLKRPVLEAQRLSGTIILDGMLNEPEWSKPGVGGFTQKDPNEGEPATEKTEVWIAYDDEALYVAARMYDKPDSIVSRLGRRDVFLDADYFYFGVDSYHDKRTGFYFMVYPSGSIVDGILYNDSWDDNSWDGVWSAVTSTDERSWTVEMKIPYSQLRFPKQDEYVWGVNFKRLIHRKNESSYLVMVPKKESGWVSRFADLNGIRNINPPERLEFLPYVVGSLKSTNQFTSGDPYHKGTMFDYNMGLDVKYGLGNNLTLNATINPDFGQVEVDPAVVNLTQFETFFQEKRPFFIEGSNFFDFGYGGANNNWGFNWGSPDYFYSRRIGRSPFDPQDHSAYDYTDLPNNTTILGAAKVTGKLSDHFSLGGLLAGTEREYVEGQDLAGNTFRDVAEPFTGYGVARGLYEINNGNQALGFIMTGTKRDLNETYLEDAFNSDAYAFGLDGWTNLDSAKTWVLTGWGSFSYIAGSNNRISDVQQSPLHYYQRPDADHLDLDTNATSLSGFATRFALNKQHGNFKFNSAFGLITSGFETNDLGFLFRTDVMNFHVVSGYRWYEPEGIVRGRGFNVATFRNFDLAGNKIGEGYFLFYDVTFSNFWGIDGTISMNPASYDRTSTRGGPWMKNTNGYSGYLGIWSDSRSPVVGYMSVDAGRSESGGYRFGFYPSIDFKPAPNVSVSLSPSYYRDVTMAQYVGKQTDALATETFGKRYLFGKLDYREVSSNIRLDWTFSPKLSLQLFVQPLIAVGSYDSFKELQRPREYSFNAYGTDNASTVSYDENSDSYTVDPDGPGSASPFEISNPNFNFKSLRGNAVLRFEYLPGSTLYFVWTRGGTNSDNAGSFDFGRDFNDMLTAPDHEDVFLVKLAYWITP